jgi:HlyD family secretion protein
MKKGCLIAALVVIGLASIGLVYYFYTQNDKDPIEYEYTKAEINDIIKKAVATGSINPRKEVNIKPQVSGVIEKLYVEAGELVSKGQKLALIKLIPSEVNINSAKSNLELARIRYNDAQRELQRQESINEKKLDVDQAQANYRVAQSELDRQRSLHEEGVISDQELQAFELDAELKKSMLENIKISSTNTLAQSKIELDIRAQELEAAQNNLQLLKEGKTSNSKQISNVVTSTMDGMVLDVPVEEGTSVIERNNFNEGTSIATVADMSSLIFEGNVDESDVGKLKEGMPLKLTVGAIDNETFEGVLEFISPKGVEEEGTVNFKIRAAIKQEEDSKTFLRAGYSANADVILEQRNQVISINERDIITEDDKTFVELVTGDQIFEKKEIKTGLSDGILIEVTEGLDTTIQIKVQSDVGKIDGE